MQASNPPSPESLSASYASSYTPTATPVETTEQHSYMRRLLAAAGIVLLLPIVGLAMLIFRTEQGDHSTL